MITLPSGRKIGKGEKPFIIAEVGSNWHSLEDCRHSIAMAKAAGADAVKFQLFTPDALYGPIPGGWERPIRMTTSEGPFLPVDWLPHLKDKADKCGIEFMCSAFSPELIDAVDPFVSIHKVASAEMTHVRMLERLRAIGKPVILSTGASGEADIAAAIKTLGDTSTVLLYCVAAYPAREVNLSAMLALEEAFKKPVGYSDHTTDIGTIPVLAVKQYGATVLEKHFKDGAIDGTPDAPHSLTPPEFARMVGYIHDGHKKRIGYTREEHEMITTHNRRLIATRDIPAGTAFIEGENFGIYRSLKPEVKGLNPFALLHVARKRATRDIKAGDGISLQDLV